MHPTIDTVDHAPRLTIPSGRDDTTVVLAGPALPFADDVFVDVMVEVDAPGLQVRSWVRTLAGDDLPGFLAGLDADFRGWQGVRRWRSLEGDLSIEARHSGRRVTLGVTVSRDHRDDTWGVTVPLEIEPGEELHQLAVGAADFFRAALAQLPTTRS